MTTCKHPDGVCNGQHWGDDMPDWWWEEFRAKTAAGMARLVRPAEAAKRPETGEQRASGTRTQAESPGAFEGDE